MLILTNQAKDKPSKNASEAENAVSETEQVPDKNPPNKESISADDSQPTVVPEKKKKGNKSHGKDVALKEASKQETRSKELLLARSAGTEKPKEKERLPQTKPMTRRQSRGGGSFRFLTSRTLIFLTIAFLHRKLIQQYWTHLQDF